MQNPQGHVVSVISGASGKTAIVRVDKVVVCERCESGKGCGAGLLGSSQVDRQVEALIPSGLEITDGDRVIVELEPQNLLRAAIVVYGYPLSGAVLMAVAAYVVGLGDVASAIAALAGIGAGVVIARNQLANRHCLRDFTPTVVATLPTASD
jgi:positive regulator of sigma E activity